VPIYEYRCAECDERFEELHGVTVERPACPSCGSQEVERVYSTFGTKWKPSLVNWHRVP
jgi:putative FmdB family regulatory protein